MAGEEKRFIDQVTDTALSAGDYIMVDSSSEGTRKFDLGTKLAAIDTAIAAEATARENADSQLKEDLDQIDESIYIDEQTGVSIADIDGISTYVGAANIFLNSGWISIPGTGNYDSYYKIVDQKTTIWFDNPTSTYVSICVGENVTQQVIDGTQLKIYCSNMARYRKSENNLPTIDNPLTIQAGGVYVISLTKNSTDMVYGLSDAKYIKRDFASQAVNQAGVYVDMSAEEISLLGAKYKVIFKKKSTAQGYQWNITSLSKPDGSNVLPTSTDIIGVLQYDGENNFMGGGHGNESNVDYSLWAEGNQITESGIYKNVRVWMNSHLYSVNDPTVNAVDRFVEMCFNENGWISRNTFKIIVAGTVKVSYASGLFGFNRADVNLAVCNLGPIDLTATLRQYNSNKFKQLIVNFTDNLTVTFKSDTGENGFVTYRSSTESYKAYFADVNNQAVSAGDYITGECEYIF